MHSFEKLFEWLSSADHAQTDAIMIALGFWSAGCGLIAVFFVSNMLAKTLEGNAQGQVPQNSRLAPAPFVQPAPNWHTSYDTSYVESRFGKPRAAEVSLEFGQFASGRADAAN